MDCLSELGGDKARNEERQGRIQRGEWGYEGDGDPSTSRDRKIEEFGAKSLEGVELNAREFEEGLRMLLDKLGKKDGGGKGEEVSIFFVFQHRNFTGIRHHSNFNTPVTRQRIRYLTFRLDFNSFYQRKYEGAGAAVRVGEYAS